MRTVLADNVKRLMDAHFRDKPNRPKSLAAAAGVSLSTVQRVIESKTGASLDNIEAIAGVFHLSAYQILVPNLDIENPAIIKGATQEEQRLYRNYAKSRLNEPEREVQ